MIRKRQIGDQIQDHNRGELRGHPEASRARISEKKHRELGADLYMQMIRVDVRSSVNRIAAATEEPSPLDFSPNILKGVSLEYPTHNLSRTNVRSVPLNW